METLEIEDLKNLLCAIGVYSAFVDYADNTEVANSLKKSRAIIEQMIKDKEFERESKPLPF